MTPIDNLHLKLSNADGECYQAGDFMMVSPLPVIPTHENSEDDEVELSPIIEWVLAIGMVAAACLGALFLIL